MVVTFRTLAEMGAPLCAPVAERIRRERGVFDDRAE